MIHIFVVVTLSSKSKRQANVRYLWGIGKIYLHVSNIIGPWVKFK